MVLTIVLWIYYSYLAGIVGITIPTVVIPLAKKYLTFGNLDEQIKKFLSSKRVKIILSIILFLASVVLYLVNSKEGDSKIVIREFAGIVWDENDEPLPNVIIVLPELNLRDTTDDLGMFKFFINNYKYPTVDLIATRVGYETFEGEGSTDNKSYNFKMIKK